MKFFKNIFCFLSLVWLFASCQQDEFLDLVPKDQLTEATTFTSYENILTYSWGFYDVFPGFVPKIPTSERNGDLFLRAASNGESDWVWQRITVPSSSSDWKGPYSNIRRVNIMLDNLDASGMPQTDIDHWKSVGYFFRAYNYFELVKRYGSVPWIEHKVGDDDEVAYDPRTPRNEVTKTMLEQLQWAEQHIKPKGDGPNTIDVHAVRALISRFGLFEGTWRKYHNLGEEDIYLRASVNASEKLMSSFPDLHSNYDELFNSESLLGVSGIILFKPYESNQFTHGQSNRARSSSGRYDLTKKAADMYLMTDGETRWTSPLFEGDKSRYTEFRNRDRRMYYTVTPPFKVNTPSSNSKQWTFTENPVHREYIDLMGEISDPSHKELPQLNWQGTVLRQVPHYVQDREGQAFIITYTGYYYWKNYNRLVPNGVNWADISDAPIFRMGEVLVNYAEAKFELDEFDQGVADQTINKLRARGHIASLNIGSIPNDPTRDASVDPVLWEIRRERAIELMGEGFRPDDLRRWKKMDYVTERKLGGWIKRSEVDNVPILNGESEGYIDPFGQPPADFPEHYYLWPIPSNQIVLNPQLKQNPDW